MTTDPERSTSINQDDPSGAAGPARSNRVAWFVLATVCYVLFAGLTLAVAQHVAFPIDQSWLATARSWTQLDSLWNLLSNAANYPLIVIGVGIVLWLFWKGQRREAILVIIVLAACTAGSEGVKQLLGRERPIGTDPNIPGVVFSYPSGHVLEAATIFGIISIMLWRGTWPTWAKLGVAIGSALFVLAVGVARIALGEHYPTDVIAGILAGIGDLSVFALFSPRRERRSASPAPAHRPLGEPIR